MQADNSIVFLQRSPRETINRDTWMQGEILDARPQLENQVRIINDWEQDFRVAADRLCTKNPPKNIALVLEPSSNTTNTKKAASLLAELKRKFPQVNVWLSMMTPNLFMDDLNHTGDNLKRIIAYTNDPKNLVPCPEDELRLIAGELAARRVTPSEKPFVHDLETYNPKDLLPFIDRVINFTPQP